MALSKSYYVDTRTPTVQMPVMPNGIFYLNSLDRSISSKKNVWLFYYNHVLYKFLYLMQTV